MKKMMRQNETLAAQQCNKIQSQDKLLKRRSMEIQTLKKKIKEDQMKSKKLSSTRKWFQNFIPESFDFSRFFSG